MDISNQGLAELASYEALMLFPYLDSGGVKTVGIGSTSSDIFDLANWAWDKQITIKDAVDIYRRSLIKYVAAVNNALKVPVSQHQFDAIVSFTYNVGTTGMSKSTFIKLINKGANNSQIIAALKMWNKDNGKVIKGLINRRQKEADLFTTGKYSANGHCSLIQVNPNTHKPIYSSAKQLDLTPYF